MPENKELTQEELFALLKQRASEKTEPVRTLSDEELDSAAGGNGCYVIGEANGTRITAYCEHPLTTDEIIKQCLTRGGACSYGVAEGARSCFSCRYMHCTATQV